MGGRAVYTIEGNAHDDFIICDALGGTVATGGTGNDRLFAGDGPGDLLGGNEGDDLLCKRPFTAAARLMDGGAQFDRRCGSATTVLNVEQVNCAACGF